jgi:hypothetical protein
MGKQKMEPSPEDLDPVRQQIKAWREIRKLPGPMPREIWDRAIVLARAFGVCKVARAVGLDDTGLRQKVAKASEEPGLVKPTFVELPGRVVSDEAHGGAETFETQAFHPDLSHRDPVQGPQLAGQVPGAPFFFPRHSVLWPFVFPFLTQEVIIMGVPHPNRKGKYWR